MKYSPRVKFHADLAANGDIIPGAAFAGYATSTLPPDASTAPDPSEIGLFHCLLETADGNGWQLIRYDATAATGFRKKVIRSGGTAIASGATGLTCSFVAHPNSYVLNTHPNPGDASPAILSANSTGVGAMATVGVNSPNSLAIAGWVRDDSPRSIAVGGWAGAPDATTVGLEADAGNYEDASYVTISTKGSVAVGYRAKSTAAGEVALGSANMSHMSGIPIETEDPSVGGTFAFKAVGGFDTSTYLSDLFALPDDLGPMYTARGNPWVIHIEGTIVARATDAANNKVVKVEWVTDGTLTQTVLTQGANNISLGLAIVNYSLQATVAATAGLKLFGYLRTTKLTV